MSKLFDLDGRVALVTGATGGLGSAICHALAAHGARVIVSDTVPTRCEELCAELSADGFQSKPLPWDLGNRQSISALSSSALNIWGQVDILVCNAGVVGPVGSSEHVVAEDWDEVMAVNLYATAELTARLVPAMANNGWGCVILMWACGGTATSAYMEFRRRPWPNALAIWRSNGVRMG